MRTPGEILVQTAFRLYHDNPEKLQKYLSKRIDDTLENRMSLQGDSDLETIILFVCEICSAHPKVILTKFRGKEAVESRAILYKILTSKSLFGWTQARAGLYFGGRDHSSVIHALRNFDDWSETDKVFRRKADTCMDYAFKTISQHYES